MPSSGCKTRPISADPSRYPSTRASISHNVSNLTNDACSSLLDTSTKFFLTSTQQGFYPSVSMSTARKTATSFNKTFNIIHTPKRPTTAKKDEDSMGLNLSMALLEVTDDKGNPLVRPIRKLQTNKFHQFLYRFRQEKEELEQKIGKLYKLEHHLKTNKLRSTARSRIEQSLLEKSLGRKAGNQFELQSSQIQEQEPSYEETSQLKVFRHSVISSALSANPTTSVRAKGFVLDEKDSQKQCSILDSSSTGQKISPRNSINLSKNIHQSAITEEKFVPYSSVNQNSIEVSRIEESKAFGNLETQHSEAFTESGKYFFTKASREKGNIDREKDIRNAHLSAKVKPHTLTISLTSASSPNKCLRQKYNMSGDNDRSITIHSMRNGNQSRFTPERGSRKKNDNTKTSIDSETLQELFDALTIQGSTVEPRLDASAVYMNSHNPSATIKRHAWSAKIQRRRTKNKDEEKSDVRDSQGKENSFGYNKELKEGKYDNTEVKQRARTVEWTLQRKITRKADVTTRNAKDEELQEGDRGQSQRDKEKGRKRGRGSSLFIDDTGKARLEGWDVVYTNENLEKGILT